MFKTYKITFTLLTPVSFIDIPTFDGILAYAYARDLKRGQFFTQPLSFKVDELIDFSGMPIEIHPDGYFIASSMIWDNDKAIDMQEKWRKRWDGKNDKIADFGKQKRKIRVNAGQFKSYDMPIQLKVIEKVWFFFKSDKINEVDRLIRKYIFFIGKKRSQGYGETKFFKIEETEFDFEKTIYRPVPEQFFDPKLLTLKRNIGVSFRFTAWKPPYWLPDNFTKCILPFYK
jgi:hypothetical protein